MRHVRIVQGPFFVSQVCSLLFAVDFPRYHSCVELEDEGHDVGVGFAGEEKANVIAIVDALNGKFEVMACMPVDYIQDRGVLVVRGHDAGPGSHI